MRLKIVVLIVIALFLLGTIAAVDAKVGRGGGGKSGGFGESSKSVSSSSSSSKSTASKVLVSAGILGASKKKKHLDDDLFENETNDTDDDVEEAPGLGLIPGFLAIGLLIAARKRRVI